MGDQGGLLSNRIRALWSLSMPHLEAEVEDGQGDWRQKDGGPAFSEVERDGPVQLHASAASRLRHLQELRGPFSSRLHGRQWRGYAWQSHLLRAERGGWCRWQEEVTHLHACARRRAAGWLAGWLAIGLRS